MGVNPGGGREAAARVQAGRGGGVHTACGGHRRPQRLTTAHRAGLRGREGLCSEPVRTECVSACVCAQVCTLVGTCVQMRRCAHEHAAVRVCTATVYMCACAGTGPGVQGMGPHRGERGRRPRAPKTARASPCRRCGRTSVEGSGDFDAPACVHLPGSAPAPACTRQGSPGGKGTCGGPR